MPPLTPCRPLLMKWLTLESSGLCENIKAFRHQRTATVAPQRSGWRACHPKKPSVGDGHLLRGEPPAVRSLPVWSGCSSTVPLAAILTGGAAYQRRTFAVLYHRNRGKVGRRSCVDRVREFFILKEHRHYGHRLMRMPSPDDSTRGRR